MVVCAGLAVAAKDAAKEYQLPNGKTGVPVRCNFSGATYKTKTGVVTFEWHELGVDASDAAGRESGHYRIISQRVSGEGSNTVTRSIVHRMHPCALTNYLVVAQNHAGGTIRGSSDSIGSCFFKGAPYFIDDHTVVRAPDWYVVGYRDMDLNGSRENVHACRIMAPTFKCRKTLSDGSVATTNLRPWMTRFKLGDTRYIFNLLTTNRTPTLPVRSKSVPNSLLFEGKEYPMKDLVRKDPLRTGWAADTIGEWESIEK